MGGGFCFRALIALLSFLLASDVVAAPSQKIAVYFGGGLERTDPENQFDDSFRQFIKFTQKRGWLASYFFDKHHKDSRLVMIRHLQRQVPDFTSQTFKEEIDRLVAQLESGRLTAGDQILLQFDTHGAVEANNFLVSTTIDTLYPISDLKRLKGAAEKTGVRLAILGSTCHSGPLQELASATTCVISLAGAKQYGFSSDSYWLNKQLGEYKNLEQAYLAARHNGSVPTQPIISTKNGSLAAESLNILESLLIGHVDWLPEDFDRLNWKSIGTHLETRAARLEMAGRSDLVDFIFHGRINDESLLQVLRDVLHQFDEEYEHWRWLKSLGRNGIVHSKMQLSEARMNRLRDTLSHIEREMYYELYKRMPVASDVANPCRDFAL